MLDVPRHESRRAADRGTLRLDFEPQLRRAPGTRRSHSPDESAHGGGRRRSGPDRGRPEMGEGARRAMMEPFVRHTGRLAALPRANVDTDQIVPKQFLKRVERPGFRTAFSMEPYRREMLLQGLDEIGRTLRFEDRIGAYEKSREAGNGRREGP